MQLDHNDSPTSPIPWRSTISNVDGDVVRWQGSQPTCPALEALLLESSVSERQGCEFVVDDILGIVAP